MQTVQPGPPFEGCGCESALNRRGVPSFRFTVSPAFSPSATHIAPPCIILIRQKGPLRLASLLKTRPGAPSFDQKWSSAIRLQSDESCRPYSGLEVERRVRKKKGEEEEVCFEEKHPLWVWSGENGIDEIILLKKKRCLWFCGNPFRL